MLARNRNTSSTSRKNLTHKTIKLERNCGTLARNKTTWNKTHREQRISYRRNRPFRTRSKHFLIATEQTQKKKKKHTQKRQKGTNQNRNKKKTLTNVNKETNAMKIKQQRA